MKLSEIYEPFITNYIIDNFDNFPTTKNYDLSYRNTLLKQLKTYKNKSKNNIVDVEYKYSGVGGKGRLFSKGASLQNFPREIRNTLAQKNYIDIDLKNSSYNCIYNYCKKNNLPCSGITDYIENRTERLQEIIKEFNISKEDAKKEMIKCSNSEPKKLLPFMKNIISEIKSFVLHIENNDLEFIEEMKLMKINKSSKTRDYGSISTFYYQRIEKQIIKEAIKYLESHNYKIGCVIHDGFLLELKNLKLKYLDETLQHLNKHIKQELNYDVEFIKKDFTEKLEIPEEILNMDNETHYNQNKLDYENLKLKFEENYFKIQNPACYVNFDSDGHIHRIKNSDIVRNFIDWKPAGTKKFNIHLDTNKPKTFIENYIRDPYKKTYNKLGYYIDREKAPKNNFNTFRGFDFEGYYSQNEKPIFSEEDFKGLETIKEFYHYILNDNSEKVEEYYNYLIQYFAHIIFNPSEKTKVHICLKSQEGNGKNLTFEYIGKELLGSKYYLETSNPRKDIFGDFNSIREKKKLIVFNEADPAETKYFYEQLKDTTTNNELLIKRKYYDDEIIQTHEEITSTTNNEVPIKLSESNRRFVMFECLQEKREYEYYGKLYFDKDSYMKNENIKILFLDYLKSVYNPNFNFSKFPKSKFYMRSLEYSKDSILEYFKYIGGYLDNNQKLDFFKNKKNNQIEIIQNNFYKSYRYFMESNGFNDFLVLKAFRLELEKYDIFFSKHSNKGKIIYFNKNNFIEFLKSKNIYEKMEFLEDSDSEEEE